MTFTMHKKEKSMDKSRYTPDELRRLDMNRRFLDGLTVAQQRLMLKRGSELLLKIKEQASARYGVSIRTVERDLKELKGGGK
jgi:hypothetical protein